MCAALSRETSMPRFAFRPLLQQIEEWNISDIDNLQNDKNSKAIQRIAEISKAIDLECLRRMSSLAGSENFQEDLTALAPLITSLVDAQKVAARTVSCMSLAAVLCDPGKHPDVSAALNGVM